MNMIDESYTQRVWKDYIKQVKELKEKGLTEEEMVLALNSSPLLVQESLKKLKEI